MHIYSFRWPFNSQQPLEERKRKKNFNLDKRRRLKCLSVQYVYYSLYPPQDMVNVTVYMDGDRESLVVCLRQVRLASKAMRRWWGSRRRRSQIYQLIKYSDREEFRWIQIKICSFLPPTHNNTPIEKERESLKGHIHINIFIKYRRRRRK